MSHGGNEIRSRFLRNLDWNLLKVFAEVARSGGVSRAARIMARQQPSVSSALKRLEGHLGVVLCRRGPAGFGLTDEGKVVLEACEKIGGIIASMPGAFEEISGELRIQLRMVTVSNIVSPTLDATIARFHHRYPRSELLINVAPCPEIPQMILDHVAEIGVAPVERKNDQLNFQLLYREQHVVVCGANHTLFGKAFDNPKALAGAAFVLPGVDEAEPVRRYREMHRWGQHHAGGSLDLNEVRRMVVAGVGVALLPLEFLEDDIRAGRIWQLMKPAAELQDDIYVITHPGNPRRHAVEIFLDFLNRN
jgi:LysR family transcriptional regulator, transcriptional activator for bauABCD operon